MFTWLVCVDAALGVLDGACWFVGLGAFAGGCVCCFWCRLMLRGVVNSVG